MLNLSSNQVVFLNLEMQKSLNSISGALLTEGARERSVVQEEELKGLFLESMLGNQASYERFLKKITVSLRSFLKRSQKERMSDEKLEDLVQETLIAIHTKLSSYREDLPILPWVLSIAKNRMIDASRAEKRTWNLKAFDSEIENYFYPPKDNDLTEHFSRSQEVELMLSKLSERQRQILFLAKAEQLSILEIAEKFKMSISAVKVTVHRAIGALRQRSRRQL